MAETPEPDAEALALANAPTHKPLLNQPVGHPMLPGGVRHVTVCTKCREEWPCSVDALRTKLSEAEARAADWNDRALRVGVRLAEAEAKLAQAEIDRDAFKFAAEATHDQVREDQTLLTTLVEALQKIERLTLSVAAPDAFSADIRKQLYDSVRAALSQAKEAGFEKSS